MEIFRRILDAFGVAVLAVAYRLLLLTWRIERIGYSTGGPGPRLWAHWHGDELLLLGAEAGSGMAILSSLSRDGRRMAWLARVFGYRVARGSSSRGGAAGLKGLIDIARAGGDACLAVDGPRGPRCVVKPGILKLAQASGAPIYPGGASATRKLVFSKAWNRCYLPLPFSRCYIVVGPPVVVPPGCTDEEAELLRVELEQRMLVLSKEAERLAGEQDFPRLFTKISSGA